MRRSSLTKGTTLILVCSLASTQLIAEQGRFRVWNNLQSLRPGQKIEVRPFKQMGKKVRGRLIAADPAGITLRDGRGERRIGRESVRWVGAVLSGRESYGPIGSALVLAGSGLGLAANLWALKAPKNEIRQVGLLPAFIMLAGLPFLVMGGYKRVYEAPEGPEAAKFQPPSVGIAASRP